MMDSIKIETGEKRIAINDDPSRVIVFNPSDVAFAERFYNLIGELENKVTEYKARGDALDADVTTDAHNIPSNMSDRLSLLRETCEYMRGKIDHLFGADTSQKAFGGAMTLEMFEQFFTGITPFVQTARAEKIAQYTTTASAKRSRRK